MIKFSIVVCTHNPNDEVFERLLNCLDRFSAGDDLFEIVLVDNNSRPAIDEREVVKSFLSKSANKAKLVFEQEPGLTAARIRGLRESKNEWIVFFDDDNEPAANYIEESSRVIHQYPQVGLWGPGNIHVNFIGRKQSSFLESQKALFQERAIKEIQFDNNKIEGNDCYPFGTGLIIKRTILESYAAAVKSGLLTMTDRKSGSLSSGGDTQILYQGLKLGYYAGSAPSIKLTHNILSPKVKFRNLLKLIYHLNAGQVKAYNEVFTAHPYPIQQINQQMVINIVLIFVKRSLKNPVKFKYELLDLAKRLGMLKAQILAGNQPELKLLKFWEKLIKA